MLTHEDGVHPAAPLPSEYILTMRDVQAYVRALNTDNAAIAYFQIGYGILEQAFLWKYPTLRQEGGVLVLKGITAKEQCRIFIKREYYLLPPTLSELHYFFCSIPYARVSDPLTRHEWVAYCEKHWNKWVSGRKEKSNG
jgi:hypothetical protein